jgi:hypothetical protein
LLSGVCKNQKTPPIISDDRRRFLWADQKSQRVVTITLRGSGVIDNGF